MAPKCPTCGEKAYTTYRCTVCGKQICKRCGKRVFGLETRWLPGRWSGEERYRITMGDINGKNYMAEEVYVCAGPCETDFLAGIKKHTAEIMRGMWEEGKERERLANAPAGDWWRYLLYTAFFEYIHEKNNLGRLNATTISERPSFALPFERIRRDPTSLLPRLENELTEFISSQQKLYKQEYDAILRSKELAQEKKSEQELLSSISYCERVGRYEEAASDRERLAQIYEKWGSYDKARELRDGARRLLGKGPQVVVDLNKLIQQVKDSGIVVVYRCPRCGAALKVGRNTSADSIKVCEHCGSEIETMDLANFLRTALS